MCYSMLGSLPAIKPADVNSNLVPRNVRVHQFKISIFAVGSDADLRQRYPTILLSGLAQSGANLNARLYPV